MREAPSPADRDVVVRDGTNDANRVDVLGSSQVQATKVHRKGWSIEIQKPQNTRGNDGDATK